MASRRLLLAALPALLLWVPGAAAQAPALGIHNPTASTPTTLYMHLLDLQDFPINTQKPDDKWTQSQAWGLATSTTSCLPKDTPGAKVAQEFHTFYGYSSPSYVEYNTIEGGKPRIHPERGISYDALLDANAPFDLYWYMTAQSAGSGGGLPADPDAVPTPLANVVVAANIRAGDGISVNDHLYNTGPLLVHGSTTPATLVADQVVPVPGQPAPTVRALGSLGNGTWLYEFRVPMTVDTPVIPRATGYNLRVDVYMDNPACGDPTGDSPSSGAIMPNTVRIHSDALHRPRMQFSVLDPIRIDALHPQFVGDELVVHAAMNAVWGNYDVAEPSIYTPDVVNGITMTVTGPTDPKALHMVAIVSHSLDHYQHQNDVTAVYDWPYKEDSAAAGVYHVHLEAWNDQHTAMASADSQFEIGRNTALNCTLGAACTSEGPLASGPAHTAPAAGLPAVLGVLAAAAAALAVRRRTA